MHRCFDKRVLAGLAIVAAAVFVLSPRLLGSVAPILIMAACPISMLVLMGRMTGEDRAAAPGGGQPDRQHRELEEEVNRLKAELALRDQHKLA